MAATYVYGGDRWFLSSSLGANNTKLKLFVTNVTPSKADTVSTYTECTATGYLAATLASGSWSVATVGSTTTASYATVTFNLTATATCYGYYITDSGGTVLIAAEAFSSVFNIPAGGGSISITLALTAS